MPSSNQESFHQRLESLFLQALELDPSARDSFLARACPGNEELRAAVDALLSADDRIQRGSRWDSQAIQHEATLSAFHDANLAVDRYRILALVGSGGMGAVYRAVRDDDSFSKVVALKIVHNAACDGPAGPALLQRFRQERQILARLEHPNIARLLDGGSTPDGRPFLVMEFVEGVRIDRYIASRRLPLPELLQLFRKICAAVSYAHSNLVVHRDLKPANILVTADGEPKLLDFGVAKLLDSTPGEAQTLASGLTPRYASPEQFSGDIITTASDVYSLGVLLFELLTAASPYSTPDDPTALAADVLNGRVRTLSAASGQVFPGDLESIAAMAMRREPRRRYQYVDQLAEDIGRFLGNFPVEARPDSAAYRVRKYIRRNRLSLSAASAIAAVLVVAATAVVAQRDQARRNEDRYHQLSYQASMTAAFEEWQSANPTRTQELLNAQRPAPGDSDLRGFEWYMLWDIAHARSRMLRELPARIYTLSFSSDGRHAAVGLGDGSASLWKMPSERQSEYTNASAVAVSPNGAILAAAHEDGVVRLWDTSSRTLRASFRGHSGTVFGIVFSPDGRMVCTTSADGTARLWPVDSSAAPLILSGHRSDVRMAVFSPDGRMLATASLDQTARLWDVATGREIAALRGHSWQVLAVDFSPDGTILATAGSDGFIKFWDVKSYRKIAEVSGEGVSITSLRFSGDGKLVAAGAASGAILLIDVPSYVIRETLAAHSDMVSALAFSPDGRTLYSGSFDRTLRSWNVANDSGPMILEGHRDWIWDLKFSPDSTQLASAGKDAIVTIWNTRGGTPARILPHREWVNGIAFSPDGRLLASASDDRLIRIWEVSSGTLIATLAGHPSITECVVFSPDGRTLASGGKDGEIILWDVHSHMQRSTLRSPYGNLVWDLAFSPDGNSLAAAEGGFRALSRLGGHIATIWNPRSGALLATLDGHTSDVRALAFSPDGKTLVTGSFDGTVKFWDFATRTQVAATRTHQIRSLSFLPNGSRLVTAGHDKTIRLWHLPSRQEICGISIPNETSAVVFSPDGRKLAAAAHDGKVRLWTSSMPEPGQ